MGELRTASDGLPARVIKAHSLDKFDRHAKYAAIFNNSMRYHWRDNRGYLELLASGGLAIDDETGEEVVASPLRAAELKAPGFNLWAKETRSGVPLGCGGGRGGV